jgi:hypothetical protein
MAFRGKDIMDYDREVKDAKDSRFAILYYSADNLVLIKEIQSYHTIRNLCTAIDQSGIYALHILITGTGHKYPFNPKTEKEKAEHAQPFVIQNVRHPLIVTLNEHPPLVVGDQKFLEEIYRAFVG